MFKINISYALHLNVGAVCGLVLLIGAADVPLTAYVEVMLEMVLVSLVAVAFEAIIHRKVWDATTHIEPVVPHPHKLLSRPPLPARPMRMWWNITRIETQWTIRT